MNYDKLSKEVAYALRHSPGKYELELDANGWVSVDQLLESLRNLINGLVLRLMI